MSIDINLYITMTVEAIVYLCRILVTYIPMFKDQNHDVTWHIEHMYSQLMSTKSQVVSLHVVWMCYIAWCCTLTYMYTADTFGCPKPQ